MKQITEKRIVVALGGNALGDNPQEQLEKVRQAAVSLVSLIAQGNEIVVAHGNGPQVGMISLAFEEARKVNTKIPFVDLPECTAMSQGYIAFHLQSAIDHEMQKRGMPYHTATVVTEVEVDKHAPEFQNPTKPIGLFYTKEEADAIQKENPSFTMTEDAGRGYRRVVPSPKPQNIIEKDAIVDLLEKEFVVIACGGGGVPVVKDDDGKYQGVASVIDKDFASTLLAQAVDADFLLILTAVDQVAINFNTPEQHNLASMSLADVDKYIGEGQFSPGSMLPKIEAAKQFVESAPHREAIIGSLEKAAQAVLSQSGTRIHR